MNTAMDGEGHVFLVSRVVDGGTWDLWGDRPSAGLKLRQGEALRGGRLSLQPALTRLLPGSYGTLAGRSRNEDDVTPALHPNELLHRDDGIALLDRLLPLVETPPEQLNPVTLEWSAV